MQCSLCFVNNSPRSNQDKDWTCLCGLGYLQQAQKPNYTASNKQWRLQGNDVRGRGPAWAQEPLRAPDVITIVCGCRHACWDSVVMISDESILCFLHLGFSSVMTHYLWSLTLKALFACEIHLIRLWGVWQSYISKVDLFDVNWSVLLHL